MPRYTGQGIIGAGRRRLRHFALFSDHASGRAGSPDRLARRLFAQAVADHEALATRERSLALLRGRRISRAPGSCGRENFPRLDQPFGGRDVGLQERDDRRRLRRRDQKLGADGRRSRLPLPACGGADPQAPDGDGLSPVRSAEVQISKYGRDVNTVDFSGWPMIVHADMPDEVAYALCQAIEARKDLIPTDNYKPVRVAQLCADDEEAPRGIPFHPGAERFYRQKGYLK